MEHSTAYSTASIHSSSAFPAESDLLPMNLSQVLQNFAQNQRSGLSSTIDTIDRDDVVQDQLTDSQKEHGETTSPQKKSPGDAERKAPAGPSTSGNSQAFLQLMGKLAAARNQQKDTATTHDSSRLGAVFNKGWIHPLTKVDAFE